MFGIGGNDIFGCQIKRSTNRHNLSTRPRNRRGNNNKQHRNPQNARGDNAPTRPIDNQSIFEDENGDLYVNCVGSFGYIPGLNAYIARTGVAILVDLYNKTIKVIDGLPHSNGHGVAMGKHGNKMVYGSANDEYNGFSTVDLTTGTVENKVVTVAGFPSFFYSFE